MKTIEMYDGSKWTFDYRKDTDDFEVTIRDDSGERVYYLNSSDAVEIIATLSEEMN